jgi:glutathione S-transferase
MAEYNLYCFAQSGNAYKAALMLELTGCDWGSRFVDFFNGETRTTEYRKLNVMGEVPVLLHRDRRLTQSAIILYYLAERTGRYGWSSEDERREIQRWMFWDNYKLSSNTGAYRFLSRFVPGSDAGAIEVLKGRMMNALSVLSAHLGENDWLAGNRMTIADISACGYLYYQDEIGVNFAETHPAIQRWLDAIAALDGWQHPYDLMPGHPLPGKG